MAPTPIRQSVAKPFTVVKLAPVFYAVEVPATIIVAGVTGLNIVITAIVAVSLHAFFWLLTEREPHIQSILTHKLRRLFGLPIPLSFKFPTLKTRNRWSSEHARFIP